MIIYPHENYNFYVAVQRKLTAWKTGNGTRVKSWVWDKEVEKINALIHSHKENIKTVVCHGCRSGVEVDLLQKLNPNAVVLGTDIYGLAYQYDRTYFREMDFDTVPEEWKDYFDVVYSNSIDHSRDPIHTLQSWRSELKEGGICVVNFHWGRGVSREDCFHLDASNYEHEIFEIGDKTEMKVMCILPPHNFSRGSECTDVVFRK